jgi:hypothetical protein
MERTNTRMSDPALGKIPGHLQVTDFDVSLEPGDTGQPFRPVVQGLRLRISDTGLRELAQALIAEVDRRAPVGIRLQDVRVGPDGITLSLRMEKGIFKGDLSTRLVLSAPGGEVLRVELADTQVPAWVPLDMLLDQATARGGNAVRRDPNNRRALLLDPAALLARAGVPGRFAPGRWDVSTSNEGVALSFRESTAAA